ncbi:MAG: hypothetical protein PHW46_06535, partial [Candidatus Omnitrophica bacterium]|nr:hypothetical protein [Candidatus Omnitrophota bacterium]
KNPVVVVLGRSDTGVSPKSWGPIGEHDAVIHKDIGCVNCPGHNCVKYFACLKAITPEDVMRAVERILAT